MTTMTVLRAALRAELLRIRRQRAFLPLLLIYAVIFSVGIGLSVSQLYQREHALKQYQNEATQQWLAQPDRHPHRVVHFGDFAFKALQPLAAFDWGVDAYTGQSIYLEGHRQNSANFSDAGPSGQFWPLGALSPALALQSLLPLMLIALGYASVAQARADGLLAQHAVGGVPMFSLLIGKSLALAWLAWLWILPILALLIPLGSVLGVSLIDLSLAGMENMLRLLVLVGAYLIYGLIWALLIVLVSACTRSATTQVGASDSTQASATLISLLSIWLIWVLLSARLGVQLTEQWNPPIARLQAELLAEQKLKDIGDSHNPNDPHFVAFKAKTLAQYGVNRVEDLPINYGGLLMLEGERLTAAVFAEQVQQQQQQHLANSAKLAALAWLNPTLALAQLSRAASGTDLSHHYHFVNSSEAQRLAMVQALNQLHAEKIAFVNDREQRLSAQHWQAIQRPRYERPFWKELNYQGLGFCLPLGFWLALLLGALYGRAKQLSLSA